MHDIFFFTDIHGARPLFNAIMNYCQEQDPEATIIFGGDAIDRGTDGYAIMKELLDNPKVVYLKGNHEDMFCKAARELKEEYHPYGEFTRAAIEHFLKCTRGFDYRYAAIQDSLYNGGLSTLTDWVMDGMPMDLIERVEKLPLTFVYNNVDFCHAGSTYKCFKEVNEHEYNSEEMPEWETEPLLWSRTTIDIGWEPGRTCIFGHTPTPYLEDYLCGFKLEEDDEITPVLYRRDPGGWKLDMDTGAVFTDIAYVLNVLTMRAQGFQVSKNNKDQVEKISYIQFSY